MSCQQLIQEDPYVFTDTISSSTNFMQQNNSQTKYVPLNRQTIYNRQFRQHEPSIASSENISINGRQHPKSSSSAHPKIVFGASTVNQRKNGTVNGSIKSPRTSPKFFKSHQLQPASFKVPDGQYLVNSSTHHSITVSASQPAPSNQQQLQQQQQKLASQLSHAAATCENGINNTGIKHGPLNGKCRGKAEKLKAGQVKSRRKSKAAKHEKVAYMTTSRPKSQSVVVESVSIAPEVQFTDLDVSSLYVPPLSPLHHLESETVQPISRDDRLSQRKIQLRRRAQQFHGIQQYRTTERSKMRLSKTLTLLKHLDRAKHEIFKRPHKSCQFESCTSEAIVSTLHCIDHILMADRQQHLIRQCSFVYGHNEQCRVPVHDILAITAVCNDHQHAPAHQLLDPAKPKKTTKRVKEASVKKSGKKKAASVKPAIAPHRPTMIIHPNDIHNPIKLSIQPPKLELAPENHLFIHHNSGNVLASSQSSYGSITSASDDLYLKQDLMTICENSYESSEDTGVGGLSENELMHHDVIGSLDMESSDELTKVLSSLATNTLDDLLTEPLQTSRDDEEYLDRAIEEVTSVGIDQIAITAFDHLDGLDMLEMMDDEEQRQMISAATNLISMSGMQSFLSNHDQDYSAMPSPMMS